MKRVFLLILFGCIGLLVVGQPQEDINRDKVWPFALSRGDSQTEHFGVKLDFNGALLDIVQDTFRSGITYGNSSICDADGKLLFFSNGCSVFGSDNEIILNGDSLNAGYYQNLHCPDGIIAPQGIIILPISKKKYWLVYQRVSIPDRLVIYDRVYYSVVEEGEDGVLSLTSKDQILLDNINLLGGNIASCRHANGRDWWLIMSEADSNKKYKILIDAYEKFSITEQNIGNNIIRGESITGNSKISPDATKLAMYNQKSDLHIFDFDRCVGELSNYKNIKITDVAEVVGAVGLAFSPNSRFVYLPSTQHIYQYDLWASDLKSSKVILAEYDGRINEFGLTSRFYQSQQGPDGKVYIGTPANRGVWHVIENPNAIGIGSQFVQHKIDIPTSVYTGGSIPHFPNFRLGPAVGTVCDSLNIGSILSIESQPYNQVVCSGSSTYFEITAFGHQLNYQWQLMKDSSWGNVFNDTIHNGAGSEVLSISPVTQEMNNWMYRCIVMDDDGTLISKKATVKVIQKNTVVADFQYKINEDTLFIQNKSQNQNHTKWYFGDGISLDSIENSGYYIYRPPYYDSTYYLEMLVQNECSSDWQRDSIEINIPRFELDFEVREKNSCNAPFWAWFENTSKVSHRILTKSWFWKRSNQNTIVPLNIIEATQDSTLIKANFGALTDPYDIFLVACDEFRCDTLRKDTAFQSFAYPAPYFWIRSEQQSDDVYHFVANHSEKSTRVEWTFEDGTLLGVGDTLIYEFLTDSTYKIIAKGVTACDETLRDTIEISIMTTNTIDKKADEGFLLFPNPTDANLTIEFENVIEENYQFVLHNAIGQRVFITQLPKGQKEQQLTFPNLPSGIYYYGIGLDDGFVFRTGKLVLE